jgi:bis(5'-nucleosyl)-tetraphosphatase (symmetrical)
MSTWVVGDLQGCCESLDALLAQPAIAADADARFWFAGDLVNRGPCSLATLRRVKAMGPRALTVLGNHDLHLLGVAAGVRPPGKSDTIQEILDAPDAIELIDWLRQQPLAHLENGHLLVHAGVLPEWTAQQTCELAEEIGAVLRGPLWQAFLSQMYGNEPRSWKDSLQGSDRLRVIVNALTRMRLCSPAGEIDFKVKEKEKEKAKAPPTGLMPWFEVPDRATQDVTVVFGHWSTLGVVERPNLLALDSGCVWGGQLTAIALETREKVQVQCPQYKKPG